MTVISVTVEDVEYTLDDLVVAVAGRLAAMGLDRQSNGQVSAFPDRRTLRYYTTIGLLDRPDAVRDRQAIYHDRHVTQAVAVKRLQAAGWTLARIQPYLSGLDAAALEAIAGDRASAPMSGDMNGREALAAAPAPARAGPVPVKTRADRLETPGQAAPPVTRRHERFWAEAPLPSAPTADVDGLPAQRMLAIPLAAGVTLLLDGERSWAHSDVDGIRDAASTLLNHLRGDAAHTERNDDDRAASVAHPA